jgi:hypothetical protein
MILGLSLSAVPGIAGGGTKAGEPTFAELLALAERDMGTKKGAAYDTLIGKQFSEKHAKSVGECVEAAGSAMPEPLKVVLVIAKDGKVTAISLSRQDEVAKCIGNLVRQEVFPKPPFAPFHDLMQMSFE